MRCRGWRLTERLDAHRLAAGETRNAELVSICYSNLMGFASSSADKNQRNIS